MHRRRREHPRDRDLASVDMLVGQEQLGAARRAPPARPRRGFARSRRAATSGPLARREGAVDLGRTDRRNARCSRSQSAQVSTGTVEHQHAGPACLRYRGCWPRLPKRVLSDITWRSRSESIGGLVTWLKFWRKNWLISRGLSEMTASGVSSPIDPIASLAASTIGARISSMSSSVWPAATWRRSQLGAVEAAFGAALAAGQVVDRQELADLAGIVRLAGDAVLDRAIARAARPRRDRPRSSARAPAAPWRATELSGTMTIPPRSRRSAGRRRCGCSAAGAAHCGPSPPPPSARRSSPAPRGRPTAPSRSPR